MLPRTPSDKVISWGSMNAVTLDVIRSGEFTAPAAGTSVKVTRGPWRPKGAFVFARNSGESVEDWRGKVEMSARTAEAQTEHAAAAAPAAARSPRKRRSSQANSRHASLSL